MSVDLRTQLNSCDSISGVQGDGPTDVDNTTGFVYQGTNSWTTQHTNNDEHIYGPVDGGSADLSDATLYLILKDNLVQTAANGGVQYVIGDGTDRIGYVVGGNDDPGMPLDVFWNCYKLDVTERANAPYNNTYAGNINNLTLTAISQVGLGTVHLAKAQGNVDNIKLDRMSYHANGSYALRINGGTSGTPENTADVETDSITNGWAIITNPKGSQYDFYAPTEWGEPVANADAYFNASDEQWTLVGGAAGIGHFPFRVVGNATDTVSFELQSVSITNIGTRASFDMSDTNIDTLDLNTVTFTDLGAITFPPNTATRAITAIIFNNCDQAYLDDINATSIIFNGTTNADGAIRVDTVGQLTNQSGFTFNSDGTGHAIIITTAGTYDLNDFNFNDYGADGTTNAAIYNNSGGAVTLNIVGGNSPTVRNGTGASTTVNNPVVLTVAGMPVGAELVITDDQDPPNELLQVEATVTGTEVYNYQGADAGNTVVINVIPDYTTDGDVAIFNEDYVLEATNQTFNVLGDDDRVYSNP